jgi:hypothetical protein
VTTCIEEGTMGIYTHIVQEMEAAKRDFDERVSNKEAHNLARSVVNED